MNTEDSSKTNFKNETKTRGCKYGKNKNKAFLVVKKTFERHRPVLNLRLKWERIYQDVCVMIKIYQSFL